MRPKRSQTSPPRILLAIPSSGTDGRDRLTGIFRYLSEGRFWDVVLPSSHLEFSADKLAEIVRHGLDGAIVSSHYQADFAQVLVDAAIPTVLMHDSWIHQPQIGSMFHFAITDHVSIGRAAANHFLSLGRFAAYGFLGDTERNRWGQARRIGYARALQAKRQETSVFTPATSALRLIDGDRFSTWLAAQPKPFALFAVNDRMAVQAATCCRSLGLHIPKDIAILGVDNDETLLSSCEPRLSSIAPRFVDAGYSAAQMMDAILAGRKVPRTRLFGIQKLIVRASTAPLPPAVKLVEDALALIEARAVEGVTPDQIARSLRVSRPLLDLRFRELKQGTLADAIRKRKLDAVVHLLRETNHSIRHIGALCGFPNEHSLKNIFKRAYGLSMSDFRGTFKSSNIRPTPGGRSV